MRLYLILCGPFGNYSHYLERWLGEYSSHQLHVLDGLLLRAEPTAVMNALQKFLKIQYGDYEELLKYDVKKGYFCQAVVNEKTKCLGKSKGRIYPLIEERSAKFLKRYYTPHNRKYNTNTLMRNIEWRN